MSRHKISRFVRSDLASSTRPGEAHTFLRVLAANGATCSARPIWPSRP